MQTNFPFCRRSVYTRYSIDALVVRDIIQEMAGFPLMMGYL